MRDILITGASSGLGRALAIKYARKGTNLYLVGRCQTRLNEVKALCEKKLAKVIVKKVDVRERLQMKKFVEKLCENNHLDVIFANAGVSGGTAEGVEKDDQVYEIFDINLYGVLNTIQPAIPYFTKRKKGQIVIVSSLAGYIALPSCPAYSASKASVRFYGNALGDYLRKYNVDVRVVSPGYVRTEMTKKNDFPMPFLMSSADAADIIVTKLENTKNPNIAFPWPMYYAIWFAGIISRKLMRFILPLLPGKK